MSHFSIEHRAERLAIFRAGSPRPCVVQNATAGHRPFIHPLLTPDENGELTENEPSHHPWQHGLYTGLNDVNGVGFWTEGLTGNPGDGSFHPLPLPAPIVADKDVSWQVVTEWRAPDGTILLLETQNWKLEDRGATLALDLGWQLRAATDLRLGKYAYGGPFLRMPWRAKTGDEVLKNNVLNSQGANSQAAAEGQRARWVALSMPLPGRENGVAGLAMLDHPANPEHPNHWRVDDNLGIAPSRCIAGEWRLAANETSVDRIRLLAFCGPIERGAIEAEWQNFAQN